MWVLIGMVFSPIRLDRGLHAYSDKLHQDLHFVATGRTKDVAAYGMITEIAENTVDKLIVKDKNGENPTKHLLAKPVGLCVFDWLVDLCESLHNFAAIIVRYS